MTTFYKTGPHVIRATTDASRWTSKAPIVKAVDQTLTLRRARPDALKIYRKYFAIQDIARHGASVASEVVAALGDAPCDVVELYNETNQHMYENLSRYVEFTREAVEWLTEHRPDLVLAAFSFSTGCPELEDWLYISSENFAGSRLIALHEYWGRRGFTPWHALRHRTIHNWLNGHHPPFVITECGIDNVEDGARGWKKFGISPQTYLQQLIEYDHLIQNDEYIVGATPFTSGATPDWSSFDTDGLVGHMALDPLAPGLAIPSYEESKMDYTFSLGFADYAAEHPEIGTAAGSLFYDADGNARQLTSSGMLVWLKHVEGQPIRFFAFET